LLTARGAHLDYNDPYFALHKMRHYDFSNMRSVALSPERLASYDCVLIATDHSSYDYEAIARDSKLVVDTNRMFTLARGGTGYYFDIVLRNEADHPITLWGFQIKTPWW
jgi:UDP-N-acetyl-D-glucosamine dehydrogenase